MPNSQQGHWTYTLNEWTSQLFNQITVALPEFLDVIYDVGANVGGWTEVMKQKYPDAKFYAFEPVFENYDALVKNVPYATNLPYGIFYGARTSKIHSRGDHNVGAFFVEQIVAGDPIVEHEGIMQLRTFEELYLPKPDLMKFDVEGAEENILEHSTLVKETPWLIIEWHPTHVNPYEFFKKHLPNHEIVVDLEKMQFLLKLK